MYCLKLTTVVLLLLCLTYESNGKENEKSLFAYDKWSWNNIGKELNKALNRAENAINTAGAEISKAIDIAGNVINDAIHKIVESDAVNIAGNFINNAVHKIVDSAADIDLVKIYQKAIKNAENLLNLLNNKVLKPGKDVTKKLAKAAQDQINDIRKNFAETKCAQAVADMRKENVRDCVQSIDIIDIGLSSCANFLTEGGPAGFFNDNVDQETHTSDGVRCGALFANLISPGVGSIIKNVHNEVKKGQATNSDVINYAESILDVIEPGLGKSIAGFANCYDLGDAEKIRQCSLTVVNTIGSSLVSKDRIDQINKFFNYFDVVVDCASVANEPNDMQNITKCVRSVFKRFY